MTSQHGRSAALIDALARPEAYPHPVNGIERLETHISWVLLAGEYAYKIKKPVDLGFLDFRTLEQRRICCETELRLNRRLAPQLYLAVVPVGGTADAPVIGGAGVPIEYAVKMKRFDQSLLASRQLQQDGLSPGVIERFARRIADFHADTAVASADDAYGLPGAIESQAVDNFRQIEGMGTGGVAVRTLASLRSWSAATLSALAPVLARRKAAGRVRECHGDLHLGNVVLDQGELIAFDCIEFSAELRWIDVISEVAFFAMDIVDRGREDLAWRFVNSYLEASGDYEGVRVLRYYMVYRALVRAKVHGLRARQTGNAPERSRLMAACHGYIALAGRFADQIRPAVIAMHGFSGSGKSAVSSALLASLPAVRIRSDVERKRLHGMKPTDRDEAAMGAGIYGDGVTADVYERLNMLGSAILESGYSLVLDATFLQRSQRDGARRLAAAYGAPFLLADCVAPSAVLFDRVAARARDGTDASDAGVAVLRGQLHCADEIGADEADCVLAIDTSVPMQSETLARARQRLESATRQAGININKNR